MPSVPEADLEHILAHTRPLWEPMRGQSLFITGGTGFFGRWLLESFAFINARLDLGARAVVLTRDPAAFGRRAPELAGQSCLTFVQGNVTKLSHGAILQQLPAEHPDIFRYVIHAATDSVGQDDPRVVFDTIVEGARRVLHFAGLVGANRFLFTSSGAVYGKQPTDLTHVPETYAGAPDCTQPASAYGEGKRAAELLCCLEPSVESVIARCFAFVGPFLPLDAHFAIGNFIRDALRGGPIRIGGDGTPYRSYLYAADLAIWLWHLLFRGEPGVAYNVGSDVGLDIESLARLVARHSRPPCEVEIAVIRDPARAPSRYVPDVTRITRGLGLPEIIGLEDAVARTMSFHKSG